MSYIISDTPSYIDCQTNCNTNILPTLPTDCGSIVGVGPEVIALWFLCDTVLTNDWATAADIITDLEAVTPLANANKMRWGGKPKKDRTTVSRAAGLPDVAVRWSQTIEFFSDYRSDLNEDYEYFNNLIELANNGGLNLAYITDNDDIYYYRGTINLSESDDVQELAGLETINITLNATGKGTGMTEPIKIAGVYSAIEATL